MNLSPKDCARIDETMTRWMDSAEGQRICRILAGDDPSSVVEWAKAWQTTFLAGAQAALRVVGQKAGDAEVRLVEYASGMAKREAKPQIVWMAKTPGGAILEWHTAETEERCWRSLENDHDWRRVPDLRAQLKSKGYRVVTMELREVE